MNKAIFLSYSSQDADTARRICDALRAAGLEVWFDQSELRGGDAWDQSIRKQIKECALFVPMISASTNARSEGYFRLEWKLAVDRSHLMADDQTFFLPVVIDDTSEPAARVPDKFRERQWTRLNDDAAIAMLVDRVQQVVQPGHVVPLEEDAIRRDVPVTPPTRRRANSRRIWLMSGISTFAGAAAIAWWKPWQKPSSSSLAAAGNAVSDPQLKRALQLLTSSESIAADIVLAEDLVKPVLDARPTDVDATATMARVHSYFLLRGFDRSEERYANAKRLAERALALAPDNPDALGAMATYLYMRRVELSRATKLCRDAIAARPDEPYYYRILDNILSVSPGISDEEMIASAKITADRFPNDALVQYELARHYRDAGMVAEAEKYLDLAIKLGPVVNAILGRARLKLWVHNDTAGMKALLDTLPERHRTSDRAVFSQVVYAIASDDIGHGIDALTAFPDPWMSDFDFTGPTAMLFGELFLLQRKQAFAQRKFEEAQTELGRHKPVLTRNFNTVWLESWLLMRLGRLADARMRLAAVHAELRRPYRVYVGTNWLFGPITLSLLLGERAKVLELIQEAVQFQHGRLIIRNAMNIDPRMAPFRNDVQIVALLTDTKK